MGSLGRVWFSAAARARFIPLSTYSSLGNGLPAKGSSNILCINCNPQENKAGGGAFCFLQGYWDTKTSTN